MDAELGRALRLRSWLDRSAADIDRTIAARLREARTLALARQRPERGSRLRRRLPAGTPRLSVGVAALLALLVAAAYVWNQDVLSEEYSEIDSALLAGELPPQAYLDPGFYEWLESGAPAARPAPGKPAPAIPHSAS